MIKKYFVTTFFNGDKILRYLNIIEDIKADLVISDYNINASIAAIIANVKNVFVTERHNFTLVDVELEDLKEGGFLVDENEIKKAKQALNKMFEWLMDNTDVIITDKPFLKAMDTNKLIQRYFDIKKAHFVGPIYSERDNKSFNFEKHGINPNAPYIIGTVSGTTMIKDDKENNIRTYIEVFKLLKQNIKDLQLVLLGNLEVEDKEDGLVVIPYVPNWRPLIEKSVLLISHPGWITITEVAKLGVPSLFYLPNFMEYHEVEAYRRMECLKIPVFKGHDINKFAEKINSIIESKQMDTFYKGYSKLSPNGDGLKKAVELIEKVLMEDEEYANGNF